MNENTNIDIHNRQKDKQGRVLFTKEMKDFTILIPMMLPIHFTLIKHVFNQKYICSLIWFNHRIYLNSNPLF